MLELVPDASGTGILFFEFYRIWCWLKRENANQPFYYMFENVAGMMNTDKSEISK